LVNPSRHPLPAAEPPAAPPRDETSDLTTSMRLGRDARPRTWRSVAADYLLLTKPLIVALLLMTTLSAMLIAARGMPPWPIFIFTLLGGACASGGANAFNSWYDRNLDKQMDRTARRPIPSGRVPARSALIFALTLCVLSQVFLGFFVNWLAALLALAGIVYYAVLYTTVLKYMTPQNIVVGGGAGAIPPLVGWAAVSGDLSLLALYLFTIIFLWTPPHTWALMLLIEKDYRSARVPMMPAVWGGAETRWQALLYTILLFVVSLLPYSFRALGPFYLVSAALLGGRLLFLAFRLWRDGEKATARKLYKYSNYYLALLFLCMVIDAAVIR